MIIVRWNFVGRYLVHKEIIGHLYSLSPILVDSSWFFEYFFAVFYKKFNGIISIKVHFQEYKKVQVMGKVFKLQWFQGIKLKPSRLFLMEHLKSVNLQCNTVVWYRGLILMFHVLFVFIKSCKILCKNPFNLCLFFHKITKNWNKEFWVP